MQYHFELYILTDQLTPDHWSKLYKTLVTSLGVLGKFELTFHCTDNVVRFYLSCNKDLGGLSNNIEGLLLRPIHTQDELPTATSKIRFLQFVTGNNLLALKEKYAVKKARDLQYAVFKVRIVNIEKAIVKSSFYFKNAAGHWAKATRLSSFLPLHLLAIDFTQNTHYLKKAAPTYLNIEKSLHMLSSEKADALFEVDTFPYFSHNYYLNLGGYEFDKHSFIIGASGSGKSKLIGLIIDRLHRTALKMNYRVVVIDPHASLADDLDYMSDSKIINFSNESTQLFGGAATDISAATELTATLFKSLMGDQYNAKADRVLRFSLFVLFTAQNMSLDNLKRFLTDIDLRNQIIQHVSGYVPANVVHFFGADFNEMRTKFYMEAIAPFVSLIDEMQLQPTLVGEGELSLAKTIQENFLTVFSLNKVSMGEKVVKTVAGLLIQQIFLLAQARAFNQKLILVIDEVSVVQNPALASILAEARKFNLSVVLTQQYFGQVEKELRDAIFANVYNYYTFKVSEEDARMLEGNLNIELPKDLVEAEHKKGRKEQDMRIKIMTELHPRECLVRVLANGQVVPAIKAKTVTAPRHDSAAGTDPHKLKAYPQVPAPLPAKFKEAPAPAGKAIATDDGQVTVQNPGIELVRPKPREVFNLSELLAQHSSSRLTITKRKDNQ